MGTIIEKIGAVKDYIVQMDAKQILTVVGIVIILWLVVTTVKDIQRRRKSSGNYRNDFIRYNKGKRRAGKGGWWYRCAACHKWCARPGKEGANIPDSMKMEVDHIRPWSMGGSDAVWNLQPLCKPCNRSKSNSHSLKDSIKMKINTLLHPVDTIIGVTTRKAVRQSKFMKKIGIGKRK